jgi:hypothetical protein
MITRIRALLEDPAVRWLALARALALAAAPLVLWLLVTRVPLSARGAYLIAVNIAALVTLFETGTGTIVVQFAVHSRPSEIAELRGAAERWYTNAAILVALIVAVPGSFVLWMRAPEVFSASSIAWFTLALATAAGIRLAPLVCIREGRGGVEEVQRMRAVQAVAVALSLIAGLLMRRPMVAAATAAVAQLAVAAIFLLRARPELPTADKSSAGRLVTRFRDEQGRSARVWLALWIAPQLLTPVVLLLSGDRAAGEIGLHVALALAPSVLSVAWFHARYPRLGALVASGALQTFDEQARHAFRQGMMVYTGASIAVLALPFLVPVLMPSLPGRLLSASMLALILAGNFALVLFQAMLAYLRAFGDERFSSPVVVSCVTMVAGSIGGAAIGGGFGAAAGYAALGVAVTAILTAGFARLRKQRLAGA